MPLTHANADGDRLADPAETVSRLRSALAEASPDAPIAVLVHGFQYSPQDPARSPHGSLFGTGQQESSWPELLGHGAADAPVCLGFGWESRGSIWSAYHRAPRAGRALAELVDLAAALAPSRRITLLAHSLGARVALQALPHLPAGAMRRAILLAAAEYRHRAAEAADCPAGHAADFLNVTSAQNLPFDLLLEYAFAPGRPGRAAMGRGMAGHGAAQAARWTDLPLTCPHTRAALARLGHPIAAPTRRVCHGSTYSAPGVFSLYRAALHDASLLPRLRAALPAPAHRRLTANLARLASFALPPGNRTPS
ncbi:alpha/beta hydrolase [Oceanicola sp. 502str15]|uniref:alpha/beta hydrolase n=1 Tax=Oceanicola sp. 502str15 TaxID=2696061 RepID=UPI00209461E3|nr:alpha/beta hydrolase [Oceanicola sp. 502str15]MCO6382751.1 alpha/beta hydrolase [Oceanicola sp. 502str15]